MRKILVLLFTLSALQSNAQQKGILVGGNYDYNIDKDELNDSKSSQFVFNLYAGYGFTNKWTVGLNAKSDGGSSKIANNKTINNEFHVGPFVRYTRSLSDIFAMYGQLEAGIGKGKLKFNGATNSSYNIFAINLYPAVFINVHKNFGLNFDIGGLQYKTRKNKDQGVDQNNFHVNFGRSYSIGVSKIF